MSDKIMREMNYIDGITIIDTSGVILFSVKFNPELQNEAMNKEKIIGKKLFEVFPNINKENSTLINAMKLGKTIFRSEQNVNDMYGSEITTTNITMPIKSNNKIIGGIELSKDISKKDNDSNYFIDLKPDMFNKNKELKETISANKARYTFSDIITGNEKMNRVKKLAKKMACGISPIFIYGETGTGKELFAHAIHNYSERSDKPFITQNCAAIPENLFESILFGTTKGSFTGSENKPGIFELADGGTVFLDEINSMPENLQVKLLRVLQEGYVRRIGAKRERKIDVRIICASNESPEKCIKDGKLREDIYYRLCVLNLEIPPLRNRSGDIKILFNFFINKYNNIMNKNVKKVARDVYDLFDYYYWPGNVRELEHIVEYSMNIVNNTEDTIQRKHLRDHVNKTIKNLNTKDFKPLKKEIEELEKKRIRQVLIKTKGNISHAAKILDISRQTLHSKIKKYNISTEIV